MLKLKQEPKREVAPMEHESTLRIRIRQRRKAQKRQLLLLVVGSMLLGCWMWYSFFYSHTPDFAIKEIRNSVEHHDAEKLRRYVNLELLVSNAYDDLTIDLFHNSSYQDPSVKRFYTLIRPQLVKGTCELIVRHADSGGWPMPTKDDIMKGNQLGIDYEWFIEYSQLRNTEIKDIKSINRQGKLATAEIEISNKYIKNSFLLKLAMEQTDSGHWQVSSLTNYRAYLTEVIPLIQKDTIKYLLATRPISNSYNSDFIAYRTKFQQLMKNAKGSFNPTEKSAIKNLIEQQVIPTLKTRQAELDNISVPPGAQYLATLRQKSTKTTIDAWNHFVKGILNDDKSELNIAEILHKQELELDRRIENIVELLDQ